MTLVAFDRLRMLWGALDWQHGSDHPYTAAQTLDGGASANGPNPAVGARKCVIHIDRSAKTPALDDAQIHFTFLNITSGSPDDTWITSDYTTLEGYLTTFWSVVKAYANASTQLKSFNWYRVGAGLTPPVTAERVNTVTLVPGTGVVGPQIPQAACSLTFRTAVRKSWGRTYLPFDGAAVGTNGRWTSAAVSGVATAAQSLVNSAAGSDFLLCVWSAHLNALLGVEHVEADDIPDVIRKRRPKSLNVRTVLP